MDPPGRFLAKMENPSKSGGASEEDTTTFGINNNNNKNNNSKAPEYWYDIGDKKAREKASQCLRERNGAANEVVANLVKAVTATGEACPEDYATLINKASAVIQAQQQLAQQAQQQQIPNASKKDTMMSPHQQMSNDMGTMLGRGGVRGGQSHGGGIGSQVVSTKPPSHSLANNNYLDSSRSENDTPPSEDDVIEAEIRRLLKLKQYQNNNSGTNVTGNGFNTSGGIIGAKGIGGGILYKNDDMPTPYMGEESVMREYENLMRKQREIDRMRGALNDVATTSMGGGGGGLGGKNDNSFMMAGNNTNKYGMINGGMYNNSMERGGMLNMDSQGGGSSNMFNMNFPNMAGNMTTSNNVRSGGGENNNSNTGTGSYNFSGDSAGRVMPSSSNHIPDAAKDYINRLRMLRQGAGSSKGEGGGGGGMQNPMANFPSTGGPNVLSGNGSARDNATGNMSGFGGGGMPRGIGIGGGEQVEFVEEYQASLQQFLSHNGDFGVDNNMDGNRSGEDVRRASRKLSETTYRAEVKSSSALPQQGRQQLDTITCIQIPTNLEDGHGSYNRRGVGGVGGNRRPSRDDSYLPTLRRTTFGSMDSFTRPSFQSMDDIDMRDSFKSVNTMDLMSIGCSINEVYDEDVKINSENWKKYRRRMSAASQVDRNEFGASHLTGLTGLTGLTDYGSLSRQEEGDGFGVTSHVVQTKDCDGPSKNTRASQLSMVLNLEDPDECMRMSFA